MRAKTPEEFKRVQDAAIVAMIRDGELEAYTPERKAKYAENFNRIYASVSENARRRSRPRSSILVGREDEIRAMQAQGLSEVKMAEALNVNRQTLRYFVSKYMAQAE